MSKDPFSNLNEEDPIGDIDINLDDNNPSNQFETLAKQNVDLSESHLKAHNRQKVRVTTFAGTFLTNFGWIIISTGYALAAVRVIDLAWPYKYQVRKRCLTRCESQENSVFEKCIDECVDAMEEIGYGILHQDARTVIDAFLGVIVLTVLFKLTNYFLGKEVLSDNGV